MLIFVKAKSHKQKICCEVTLNLKYIKKFFLQKYVVFHEFSSYNPHYKLFFHQLCISYPLSRSFCSVYFLKKKRKRKQQLVT